MKKRSIWIWSLPLIATVMVVWHYTAPFRESWSLASFRSNHPDKVYVVCEPYQIKQGWGFYILADNKKVINQHLVPGIQGVHEFSSKEDAMKVGDLMIQKLKKGIFPPNVSTDEMKSLGVTYN